MQIFVFFIRKFLLMNTSVNYVICWYVNIYCSGEFNSASICQKVFYKGIFEIIFFLVNNSSVSEICLLMFYLVSRYI